MPDAVSPSFQRHYGLDWLRIGAFAILILYHVGMVFGALAVPRQARRRMVGGGADDGVQPVAAVAAVRRVGLCQPRAGEAQRDRDEVRATAIAAAAGAAGVRHRRHRAAAAVGRAVVAIWLHRRPRAFLAARLFPLRAAGADRAADLEPFCGSSAISGSTRWR
ncbi:hypothetical protein AB5I41_22465 [Sphingomonas sp. MMS24-JH45]